MGALIETIGLDGVEDVLGPAVAYIHDRLALYGEPPLWGRDTGIAAHALALAIRAYTRQAATALTRHGYYEPAHCTDPEPHPPHEYADDDLWYCTGTTTPPTHTHHTP